MLLRFGSARPPGPARIAAPPIARSYRAGGVTLAAGVGLLATGQFTGTVSRPVGDVVVGVAGCLLANAAVSRRPARAAAGPASREPREWTITDEQLRSGNRLGSVEVAWTAVGRVLVLRDAYLLYRDDTPDSFLLDIPRDTLTPGQEAELDTFLTDRGLLPAD